MTTRRSFANSFVAHLCRRGLKLDLVILDERAGEPADRLRKELQTGIAGEMLGKSGGVFFLTADKVPTDDAVSRGSRAGCTWRWSRVAGRADRSSRCPHLGCRRNSLPLRSRQSPSRPSRPPED